MKTGPLPLAGREVVVTRAEGPEGPLTRRLRELGAEVLHWPVVRHLPPEDPRPLEEAVARLTGYDWVVFSSRRAVDAMVDLGSWVDGGPRVAAVGQSTAAGLTAAGWPVDLVAEPARGSVLVQAMCERGCRGQLILFPASQIARATIPEGLVGLGARVDRVTAYRTLPRELDRAACRARIDSARIAAVTFASPSAVEGLRSALGADTYSNLLVDAASIAIGPTTAAALARLGHPADAIAANGDLDSLAEAVAGSLSRPYLSRRQ